MELNTKTTLPAEIRLHETESAYNDETGKWEPTTLLIFDTDPESAQDIYLAEVGGAASPMPEAKPFGEALVARYNFHEALVALAFDIANPAMHERVTELADRARALLSQLPALDNETTGTVT